jgi:hypothetical protein
MQTCIIVFRYMAALSFVNAGGVLLIFGPTSLYEIVAATLLSFLAACTYAWVFLIDMKHEGLQAFRFTPFSMASCWAPALA